KEKREFEQLEKEIPALEAERDALTNQLSNPEGDYEQIGRISRRLTEIAQELEQKEMRWLELSEMM
ncbi:MAG TPA: ABC transporter C-terminal domain-containing protein, partial [Chitinophagaceae bacterium]